MTTQSDSTVAALRTPVSKDSVVGWYFSIVILDNGEEVNLLPYGINKEFRTKCLIGNGVIIDPKALLKDF
jgi:hypothetical protein